MKNKDWEEHKNICFHDRKYKECIFLIHEFSILPHCKKHNLPVVNISGVRFVDNDIIDNIKIQEQLRKIFIKNKKIQDKYYNIDICI